jgi:hypothetical protein
MIDLSAVFIFYGFPLSVGLVGAASAVLHGWSAPAVVKVSASPTSIEPPEPTTTGISISVGDTITVKEEFINAIVMGTRDWNEWRSSHADAEINLKGTDFSFRSLATFNLSGTDLTRAIFTRANLTEADLTKANLSGTDLTRANLTEAFLSGANLTRADLTGAILTRADLTGAILARANLTEADLTGTDLTGADLTGADLSGADLTRADLRLAIISQTQLDQSFGTDIKLPPGLSLKPRTDLPTKDEQHDHAPESKSA